MSWCVTTWPMSCSKRKYSDMKHRMEHPDCNSLVSPPLPQLTMNRKKKLPFCTDIIIIYNQQMAALNNPRSSHRPSSLGPSPDPVLSICSQQSTLVQFLEGNVEERYFQLKPQRKRDSLFMDICLTDHFSPSGLGMTSLSALPLCDIYTPGKCWPLIKCHGIQSD